jgi:hypothetical protein
MAVSVLRSARRVALTAVLINEVRRPGVRVGFTPKNQPDQELGKGAMKTVLWLLAGGLSAAAMEAAAHSLSGCVVREPVRVTAITVR